MPMLVTRNFAIGRSMPCSVAGGEKLNPLGAAAFAATRLAGSYTVVAALAGASEASAAPDQSAFAFAFPLIFSDHLRPRELPQPGMPRRGRLLGPATPIGASD